MMLIWILCLLVAGVLVATLLNYLLGIYEWKGKVSSLTSLEESIDWAVKTAHHGSFVRLEHLDDQSLFFDVCKQVVDEDRPVFTLEINPASYTKAMATHLHNVIVGCSFPYRRVQDSDSSLIIIHCDQDIQNGTRVARQILIEVFRIPSHGEVRLRYRGGFLHRFDSSFNMKWNNSK